MCVFLDFMLYIYNGNMLYKKQKNIYISSNGWLLLMTLFDFNFSDNRCKYIAEKEHSNLDALVFNCQSIEEHSSYLNALILNCQFISLPNICFIFIIVAIILAVFGIFMKPVLESEGKRTIPGSIYIPPYDYDEPAPDNCMPGPYGPVRKPTRPYNPGANGPNIGDATPVEPHTETEGPPEKFDFDCKFK